MNNPMNFMQMFGQFRQNPMQFLIQQKFNIPQNIGSNPQAIVQHLLDTNQISQQQVNQARQMLPKLDQMFGKK